MPNISLPYLPVTGTAFDVADWNENIYQTPAELPAGKLSLYETSNGGITFPDNFHSSFQVESHHVRPWEVTNAQAAGLVEPLDFYEDAWGTEERYYGIAGAQLTFRQPFDVSYALFAANLFMSIWRQRGEAIPETQPVEYEDRPIKVRMYLDGVPIRHTTRELPETIYHGDPADVNAKLMASFTREQVLTRLYSAHHVKHTGGSSGKGHDQLLKGWHTFGMGVYVAPNLSKAGLMPDWFGSGTTPPDPQIPYTFDAMSRVRVYVRQAAYFSIL